ncbi:Metalloenzyme, LuxS/M16 peptidase-like protein, partial [Ochromonadaceae sp. CCMP2298]
QLIEEVEERGGMVQCIANRENIVYVMDVMRHEAEQGLDILADSTLSPLLPEDELAESRTIVELQQEELPSEVFSRDLVQRAAYIGQPLGNHHFCPMDTVESVTADQIQAFRDKHYFGENCILAIAGLDHETAVTLARKKFGHLRPGSRDRDGLDMVGTSAYTGGMLSHERELKEPFVKLAMAFEVGGWSDPQLVSVCVLQQLLGGGSSFSAGGPGKGMFTRLYLHVLNRNYWTESVEAFMSIHERSGLLGIDGACPPDKLVNLIQVIVQQFTLLAFVEVSEEELQRAKNMLKSSMMMQLESRLVQCEDIARQFVTYGKRDSPAHMCDKIDAVTAADIMAVAHKMMATPPSIGVVGRDLSHLPQYDVIAEFTKAYFLEASVKMKQPSSFV